MSMTNDRAIVSSVSLQGFSLAVTSKDSFPVGGVFSFRLLYIKPLLQSAILDILDNSVYTLGHASRRVRDILLGLSEPRNSSKKEKINFLNPNLNESQRKAVERSLEQEELSIIHGPPGTGKTTILVEVIQQYRKMGKRILVCSASHVAVDNVMEKLIARCGGLGMVRVGHPVKVRRGHIKYTLDVKTRKNEGENMEKLKEASIVFGTLTGVASTKGMKKLPQGFFDLTVVDECAQALEAAVWAVVRYWHCYIQVLGYIL